MRVELQDVSKGLALPPTSVAYSSGEAVVAVAETEQRPTVLGLIASGRMRSATGLVLIDGREDAASLRRRVALVDAPSVSDPAPDVTVAGVTAEELMFAGRTANPIAVRRWLEAAGCADIARVPIGDLAPRERIALLLELTALRKGVEGMVLVSPDRHGGNPVEWMQLADEYAARGMAVLVIAGEAAASLLRLSAAPAEPDEAAPARARSQSGSAAVAPDPEISADEAAAWSDEEEIGHADAARTESGTDGAEQGADTESEDHA